MKGITAHHQMAQQGSTEHVLFDSRSSSQALTLNVSRQKCFIAFSLSVCEARSIWEDVDNGLPLSKHSIYQQNLYHRGWTNTEAGNKTQAWSCDAQYHLVTEHGYIRAIPHLESICKIWCLCPHPVFNPICHQMWAHHYGQRHTADEQP